MAPTEAQAAQIPVPTSLSVQSTALPPLTSHLLISHLRQTDALQDLSSLLSDSLARTGWTDRVRALALELLRNGSCDTFPDLLEEVLRRAKIPKDGNSKNGGGGGDEKEKPEKRSATGGKGMPNGTGPGSSGPTSAPGSQATGMNTSANGAGSITVREGWFGPDGLPDVRIPDKTVEAGVDYLRERIVEVLEPVDDD